MCSCPSRASQVQQRRVQHRTRWLRSHLSLSLCRALPLALITSTAPAACPELIPTSAPPSTPQAIAPRAGHRVYGHAEAGRSALPRHPTSLSTSELGHEMSTLTTPAAASGSASTRSWARCPVALAATGLRRGFAAGWRGCRDVPACFSGVVRG
jgi:hypothetical protein